MKTAKTTQKQTTTTTTIPVAEGLTQDDLVVSQPVVEEVLESVVIIPDVVKAEPTVEMRHIERILRTSPHVTEVLLKSGDTVQLSTEDFQKLRDPQDPTNTIASL
jgi:hypothetical protein